MAVNRDVENFFELRAGFAGMRDFVEAALRFMDKNGIAVQRAMGRLSNAANGHAKPLPMARLREQVKRHYKKRRASTVLRGAARLRAQRQASADMLARLDLVEPRQLPRAFGKHGLGPLVRRGYITRKGDGYIRTAKPFSVERDHPTSTNGTGAQTDGAALTMMQAAKALKMSEANVRLLVKAKKLTAHSEPRTRKGMKKPVNTFVIERQEIARLAAERAAQ